MNSIVKKGVKEGIWLGGFRTISQVFSWISTLVLARILNPSDYGLMEIATILTGPAAIFSDLGLGTAIIQRENVTEDEISSLFWLLVFWGLILAIFCIILSYPTSIIFHEKKIIRVTQCVGILYVIGSLFIVPLNIMSRKLMFKKIGLIDSVSIIISCIVMIVIALCGGGVWTFLGGHITRQFFRCILYFYFSKWRPKLYFSFFKIKDYFRFGLNVSGTKILFYVYRKIDRFFIGRTFGSKGLGYYIFAFQLSSIPTDKMISLINTVSFPIFSRFQNDQYKFNNFYLKITKFIFLIVTPIYLGGFLLSDKLIPFVLGEKWIPMIFIFKIFCLYNLIVSVTSVIGTCNNAQNRPHWNLYYNLLNLIFLGPSFYIACKYGLNAAVLPWIFVFIPIRLVFSLLTLNKMKLAFHSLVRFLYNPILIMLLFFVMLYNIRNLDKYLTDKYYFWFLISFLYFLLYFAIFVLNKDIFKQVKDGI